ncbi:MAG: hypothetical protein H6765_09480 [Candidatus Peribacteria bacterium]|nr:MAG: hypothetical protein H6765_09480 [Candidatus Peribacteria bacterium]
MKKNEKLLQLRSRLEGVWNRALKDSRYAQDILLDCQVHALNEDFLVSAHKQYQKFRVLRLLFEKNPDGYDIAQVVRITRELSQWLHTHSQETGKLRELFAQLMSLFNSEFWTMDTALYAIEVRRIFIDIVVERESRLFH